MLVFRRLASLRSKVVSRHVMYSGFSSWKEQNESMHSPSVNSQKGDSFGNYDERLHLSPLFKESSSDHHLENLKIELVDDDSWHVSAGLADAWKGNGNMGLERKDEYSDDGVVANYVPPDKEDPDFDEIEDMRIRGILYYKLDKDSKEYEEYNFDFHRNKKSSRTRIDQKEKQSHNVGSGVGKDLKKKDESKVTKKEKLNCDYGFDNNKDSIPGFFEMGGDFDGKRVRTPTFNQLTAPYHEPFCLDLYVSKGSVRASIIHRATSKVVAVAHSISKDMKFDLGSTKSRSTCAAVGEVLAQRALADDIHNVVYTPRKGDKLGGKLQIVLESIIDHGVAVKVKIKQRKSRKGGGLFQPKSPEWR